MNYEKKENRSNRMLLEFESKIANMEESCPDRESYEVYYIPFYINYIFIIE